MTICSHTFETHLECGNLLPLCGMAQLAACGLADLRGASRRPLPNPATSSKTLFMAHASTMLALGTPAPDFSLPSVTTQRLYSLQQFSSAKAVVVVFLCAHCPYVLHILPELARVSKDYAARGVSFVGITSNDVSQYPGDAPAPTAAMARSAGLDFPILYDASQAAAISYAAACTPDFFVFDAGRRLAYRGQLDGSRPSRGESRPATGALNGADLRAALDALLDGQPVNPEQRPSIGCNIKWKAGNEPQWFFAAK